jgi:uncharacterized protein YcfJ
MWFKTITAVSAIGLFGANAALADHDYGRHNDRGWDRAYGRVIDVDPIIRYVTVNRPRERCYDDVERRPAPGVAGQTAVGGVIGAAIGRQFGGGTGRDLSTALGAAAGAAIAHERAERNLGYSDVPVRRCDVVDDRVTEQVVDGYRVTYVFQGRRYTTRTATPPGERIELAVDVRPAWR